jgi:hypothetical protein
MVRRPIPLMERKRDLLFLAFFLVNLVVVTYIVDIEQNIIHDPDNFSDPFWPPRAFIDVIHWYGRSFDPVLMARPVWWRMTIWIDTLFFGPYYAVAIYSFLRARDWIRIPSIIYASVIMTNVVIILGEEVAGPYASPQLPVVLALNLPWLLVPALLIARMWRAEHPFTRLVPEESPQAVAVERATSPG